MNVICDKSEAHAMDKSETIGDLIEFYKRKHGVALQYVSRNQIRANSAVMCFGEEHRIFMDTALPGNIRILVLLHEMAHIELGHLRHDVWNHQVHLEKEANLYAIGLLRPFLAGHDYEGFVLRLEQSEDVAYGYFREHVLLTEESCAR